MMSRVGSSDETEAQKVTDGRHLTISSVFRAPHIIERVFSCLNASEILRLQRYTI